MSERSFRAGFFFCGLGAGALGFMESIGRLGRDQARFINVGGIDNDPAACADFEYLTGARAHLADMATLTPAHLRAAWGEEPPDAIFSSPPCKGFSRLLPTKVAKTEKYQALNRLVLQGMFLACETWKQPPRLIVIENVPGIVSRGAELLAQVRALLTGYGFNLHEGTHDCGEVGGLAQHRVRYLMVARQPERLSAYVYRPPRQRVRACGEVLETLPLPEDERAGPLHKLPKLSRINWIRLALIPAGKDWRALPKDASELAVKITAARAAAWKGRPGYMSVQPWSEPCPAVTGNMSPTRGSGRAAVADPRTPLVPQAGNQGMHENKYNVVPWDEPTKSVIGATRVGSGAPSVADPRVPLGHEPRRGTFGVVDWNEPADAVRGRMDVRQAPGAVADPRVPLEAERRRGSLGVTAWDDPAKTVTGESYPSNGSASVADPRLFTPVPEGAAPRTVHARWDIRAWDQPARTCAGSGTNGGFGVADPRVLRGGDRFGHCDKVTPWEEPTGTVTHAPAPSSGAPAVADPRFTCKTLRNGMYKVMSWWEAAATVTGSMQVDNGPAAVADPREPEPGDFPIIIAEDGTWHRPITTLELAGLQGLPSTVRGEPLRLHGKSVARWRERIGNAVPVGAARAIAESLLVALLAHALGTWTLGSTGIWVRKDDGKTEDEVNAEVDAMEATT